jgi:cell wall-associated NlpC family hydrolase
MRYAVCVLSSVVYGLLVVVCLYTACHHYVPKEEPRHKGWVQKTVPESEHIFDNPYKNSYHRPPTTNHSPRTSFQVLPISGIVWYPLCPMNGSQNAFHIRKMGGVKRIKAMPILLLLALLAAGCGTSPAPRTAPFASPPPSLAPIGYTIQVGAFASLENASRVNDSLDAKGLDAFYFADTDGLFKVRFGDFHSKAEARRRAETLKKTGVIDTYYIVGPEEYGPTRTQAALRQRLVKTAQGYIGLPYRWGGTSAQQGFDCSGLTMTVYRLNGLNLPRSSRQQYRAGTPVPRNRLRPGDLVFFDISGRGTVSHVGLYAGSGRFIHAPKSGGTIRTENLQNRYFKRRYVGARSYLQ